MFAPRSSRDERGFLCSIRDFSFKNHSCAAFRNSLILDKKMLTANRDAAWNQRSTAEGEVKLQLLVVDASKRPPGMECLSVFIRDFSFKNLGI